jgi:hypothetical protein
MSREYTSARAQAQAPSLPPGDLPGHDAPSEAVLAWTGKDPARVREALRSERTRIPLRPGLVDALESLIPNFRLDGRRWVAAVDDLTVLDITELARMANVDADSPEGIAALGDFFETALGRAQYRQFRDHCRRNRTPDDVLLDVMAGLVEDLTGRPTQPPSPSPAGPEPIGATSRVVSLSDGTVRPMSSEEFARWQETRQELGGRARHLLDLQQEVPPPPGFVSYG